MNELEDKIFNDFVDLKKILSDYNNMRDVLLSDNLPPCFSPIVDLPYIEEIIDGLERTIEAIEAAYKQTIKEDY